MAGPLSDIRVLDLSRQLAGPWTAQMLGDLGAEVIKVERPKVGDEVRSFGPPFIKDKDGNETREAPFFFGGNRNKKSITIDLGHPDGQDLLRKLAAQSDVVIENYKVGTLARYGLGYKHLCAVRPEVIYCSVTGFGQTGPFRDQPGYDSIFQAMGGLMSINGYPDGEPGAGPMRVGIAVADIMTGMYSSIAILGALHHRERTGEGQHIDMALFDVQVASLTIENLRYLLIGEVPKPTGNVSRNLVPTQLFTCSDGRKISMTIGNDEQFTRFCKLVGRPELAEDPQYKTGAARRANRTKLIPIVDAIFLKKGAMEWVDLLGSAGVPIGRVNYINEVFENPQVVERQMKIELEHERLGTVSMVANPIKYSKTALEYRMAPPMLGQHTHDVLSGLLGLSEDEIRCLAERGAI